MTLLTNYLSKQELQYFQSRRLEILERKRLRKYMWKPGEYAKEVLHSDWTAKQAEIAQSIVEHKRTLVKAAFGVGKTFVAGDLTNWWYDAFPPSQTKVVTTAPTGNQVRNLLWTEIRARRNTQPPADITQIRDPLYPEHTAIGLSPQRQANATAMGTHAFQGTHAPYLLVIFDEAAGVGIDRWATAEDLIVGQHNRMLAIGNPTETGGPFHEAARSGLWNVISISSFEHPNVQAELEGRELPIPGAVTLGWILEKLANPRWFEHLGTTEDEEELEEWIHKGAIEWDGVWYNPLQLGEAKVLGRFPSEPTDTVWSLTWLELARARYMEIDYALPLYVGVDVARFGNDMSTCHCRIGPSSLVHESWGKKDNMETAGRVFATARDLLAEIHDITDEPHRTIVQVDTTADSGAGVADRLRELFKPFDHVTVVDVSSSATAIEPEYYPNKRSELWFNAAYRGRDGDLDLSRISQRSYDLLVEQLTSPTWKMNSKGQQVVEPKENTKKRVMRSPDDADGFNLAYLGTQIRKLEGASIKKKSMWDAGSYVPQHRKPKPSGEGFVITGGKKSRWSM